MPITFGFEAEFYSNVDLLAAHLNSMGLLGDVGRVGRHDYHCRCTTCTDLWNVPFRVQRDSSCGGEVISQILTADEAGWQTAQELFLSLQDAALEVNATTTLACGFHVHLGWDEMPRRSVTPPSILVKAWLAIERFLLSEATSGVWGRPRGFNTAVGNELLQRLRAHWRKFDGITGPWDMEAIAFGQCRLHPGVDWESIMDDLHAQMTMMGWDRHGDLITTNHGGRYEVRVWNATRVAWRMEMACRLSVALLDRSTAAKLAQLWDDFSSDKDRFFRYMQSIFGYAGTHAEQRALSPASSDQIIGIFAECDPKLGELLRKQVPYAQERQAAGVIGSTVSSSAADEDFPGHDEILAKLLVVS